MPFKIKRAYESAAKTDGMRVLVDRLWPRGVKKSDAQLAHWLKDVAPSPKLRTWFGHRPERFAEFRRRYLAELEDNTALADLKRLGRGRTVSLIYAARDPQVNHAVVLLGALRA